MVAWKDICSSSSGRTPKSQLTAEQPLTEECWIAPKKDTPHPRAKEKPQQDSRGAKPQLESNPIPARDAQRAQTNLVCTTTQTPRRD